MERSVFEAIGGAQTLARPSLRAMAASTSTAPANAPARPKLAVTSTTNIIARYSIETKNERAALGILPEESGCSSRSILQTVEAYQMLSPTT
ncbi:uncharacterized protein METZ01_LOCUS53064, partial [marine metagenome]